MSDWPECDYCGRPAVYQEPSLKAELPFFSRGTRAQRLRESGRVYEYRLGGGYICADDIEPGYEYGLRPVLI